MNFEPGGIYHIYNQGNNRQVIFYTRENYLFFLRKIRNHILPYGNILAWCLMPNHFHLMVEVEVVAVPLSDGVATSQTAASISQGAIISRDAVISRGATSSRTPTNTGISLNHSIGILLASYTRAINIQENTTGSLFRQKTKAICLNPINGISSNWYSSFGSAFMNVYIQEKQYPQVCFNYIHNNPVKAGLAKSPEDWEFSSYPDLKAMRNGDLVNQDRINELGLICSST
jgi:putative transposase